MNDEVIACLLSEREAAIRGEELAAGLFAAVAETVALPDGFRYRVAGTPDRLRELTEFIAAESRCCPFLTFDLTVEAHGGAVWLALQGSERVKVFIAETFNTRIALPLPASEPGPALPAH